MGVETILMFAAGAATIIGIILAVWVFVKIIEFRDRRRASYRFEWSKGLGSPPDITDPDHTVKVVKSHRGVRINFYDPQGRHFYSVDLEKVDSSERG